MVAPEVVSDSVTDWAEEYVPGAGLKVGVAATGVLLRIPKALTAAWLPT